MKIERVTELADRLISLGASGIYSSTFEGIKASTVMWEYKGVDGRVYGPFTALQIAAWKQQGFLTGATAVLMRQVGEQQRGRKRLRFEGDGDGGDAAGLKRSKVSSEDHIDTSSSGQPAEEEWVSSDAIDFGEYVDLAAASQGIGSLRSNSGRQTSRFEADEDDEDRELQRVDQRDCDDDDDDDS